MGIDSDIDNRTKIDSFKRILNASSRVTGFTGAGISTESGIADYRSKGGIWDRFQPVYFDEFLSDPAKRLLYWQRKVELWDGIKNAQPNSGHYFFKRLHDSGKLFGLITQNIDGLHEKSGIPKDKLVNIHGTNLEVICLQCGRLTDAHEVFDSLDLSVGVPLCAICGGLLKPNTISFGQELNPADIERATGFLNCELMIAAGSTLVVHPAASFPMIAKHNGAKLAIITLSETPLDSYADFVFNMKLGEFVKLIGM